jgi:class 3 adenylate cyclase
MAVLNEGLLDQQLEELEKLRSWSPRVISKLENFIRGGDDWALFRANPYTFAEERGVNEDEAVDLFLLASKVGLFQMTWNLICAGCGAAVQSFATLRAVCATFHCHMCSVDIETRLDDYVHVAFTISPKVRGVVGHNPGQLTVEDLYLRYHFTREGRISPGGPRFVEIIPQLTKGLSYLEPNETRSFNIEVEPGALVPHDVLGNNIFVYLIDPSKSGPNAEQRLNLRDGGVVMPPVTIAPGMLSLSVHNGSTKRASIHLFTKPQAMMDEEAAAIEGGRTTGLLFDRFLTGRRLLTSQTFRQVFGSEVIRSSDGIGVRDISILFTDLKGSTEMYDRIGDLKAFALVNQHFDRLNRAIIRNHGAIVKTIGDAVMASFENPVNAVQAARQMLSEIDAFNNEVGEREIVLKVGVHRGASIAVTLNDRLDFFGQTVNIAARVQGLADADEIYLTDDVYQADGVKALLTGLHVGARQVQLKGVQRQVTVHRVSASE